ncbi:lipid-A-disaccharide synthase [Inmirania thermothiophila]|uniref:Lipid-A-disaccharide synthase n=1 Tax=Inmirania thermothiophila TaxID=1750597 RepID=A0A3N1Y4L3_9GAMM|nr:lipid-A-disaccharide synthase [Inmirania thermothiophila]ROR32227.1 lipid-A-disaccharide synthase [Inmirania thermothiophila]
MRIGIVAGEASGDLLAAGLMRALAERLPGVRFEGVAGPLMREAGCEALADAEELGLIGLAEVVRHLPRLLRLRRRLARHFLARPPALFIGVDAPDFNLGLEARLRAAGIPTVHYVSPTVWAWRRGRVRRIAAAVDLMLTLFPFEARFYEAHGVSVRFVGHPLADRVPLVPDRLAARRRLGLAAEGELVALLPGSRPSEVRSLAGPFLDALRWCAARRPGLRAAVPLASAATRALFEEARRLRGAGLALTLVEGRSREVMEAADVVLTASGTATLEALLLKRPMVVAYRLSRASYWLVRRLMEVPHFSLPNLLAGRALVPELAQEAVTGERLGRALLAYLEDPEAGARLQETFAEIHYALRCGADERAAEAVASLLAARGAPS